jgi:hypothetical protein
MTTTRRIVPASVAQNLLDNPPTTGGAWLDMFLHLAHTVVALSPPPEQAAPKPGDGVDVWAELIRTETDQRIREVMTQRRAKGLLTYGAPLQRGDGRDHLRDLLDELLDAMAYAAALGRWSVAHELRPIVRNILDDMEEL